MKAILTAALAILALLPTAHAAPAMWEARDADSRIVLFGSVHMLPPELDWRTPALDTAIADSEHIYFETDIGPRGLAAVAVKMLVSAFQSAGRPWLDLLTHDEYGRLAATVETLGLTMDAVATMPPWVIAMQISQTEMMQSAEGDAADATFEGGVEWVLQWELPPERKAYLETPGEQFDLIAAGTIEEQVAQLVALLNQTAAEANQLGGLINAWQGGDIKGLMRFMEPTDAMDEAALEALLFQRNRNWLKTLEKLLADNSESLVVVGAAHLAGDGSVLDLLEQAGYTVTRIQ